MERAFGLLKGRWRCLLKRLGNELENIPNIVISCCVLHNICQISGDDFIDNDDILPDLLANEQRMRERRQVNGQVSIAGNRVRAVLTENINN